MATVWAAAQWERIIRGSGAIRQRAEISVGIVGMSKGRRLAPLGTAGRKW